MTTTLTPPTIPEIAALIRDAIEQAPPRRHRRIWIAAWPTNHSGFRICLETDGVPHQRGGSAICEPPIRAEIIQRLSARVVDGEIISNHLPVAFRLATYVDVHLRHGWTLVDGYPTSTEARLWRAA